MKIKHCLIGAALAVVFMLRNCFAGSFIVENDYDEISVLNGGLISSKSLSLNTKQLNYDGKTLLHYRPQNDARAPYVILKVEDYFGKEPGIYTVSKKIKDKKLVVHFELLNEDACINGIECMLKESNIQSFHCRVTGATLDGVELLKGSSRKGSDFFESGFGRKEDSFSKLFESLLNKKR